jgi:hypothetical protein
MARYAGSGKATVEGCRSIDVLEWHRRGYLQTYIRPYSRQDFRRLPTSGGLFF